MSRRPSTSRSLSSQLSVCSSDDVFDSLSGYVDDLPCPRCVNGRRGRRVQWVDSAGDEEELGVWHCDDCDQLYSLDESLTSATDLIRLLKLACPRCGSEHGEQLDSLESDGSELCVRICNACCIPYGLDDSSTVGDLHELMESGKLHYKMSLKCECGNDNPDEFVIEVDDEASRPTLRIVCRICLRTYYEETSEEDKEYEQCTKEPSVGHISSISERKINESSSDTSTSEQCFSEEFDIDCGECGNVEFDLFEKHYGASGWLIKVVCLVCFRVAKFSCPLSAIRCSSCENTEPDLFETVENSRGDLIGKRCLVCGQFQRFVARKCRHVHPSQQNSTISDSTESEENCEYRTRIRSLDVLKPGDHIAFKRNYLILHHAIVIKVHPNESKLTIISFTGSAKKVNGHFASVREEICSVNVDKETLYRFNYAPSECYPSGTVVQRARTRLGQAGYNLITNNCEHFAYWCKFGVEKKSSQVRTVCDRIKKVAASAIGKLSEEGSIAVVRALAEREPTAKILKVGYGRNGSDGVTNRLGNFGGTPAKGFKAGVLSCNILLNAGLEAVNVGKSAGRSYRDLKAGRISVEEFRTTVAEVGCESAGGFVGSTGGGFVGQLLIPVPVLGAFVGCTVGNLIGRFVGAMVGKKIGETTSKSISRSTSRNSSSENYL